MRRRLFELEREAASLYSELSTLRGDRLPGMYLLAEAGRHSVHIPASGVCELVRLVEYAPLPKSPDHVMGTFLYRGTVVVVIDLARYLSGPEPAAELRPGNSSPHEPRLDAHVIVLASSRSIALVVDQVRSLIDSPQVAESEPEEKRFEDPELVVALCRCTEVREPLSLRSPGREPPIRRIHNERGPL